MSALLVTWSPRPGLWVRHAVEGLVQITKVQKTPGYPDRPKVWVRCADGIEGTVDVTFLSPAVQP